MSRMTAYVPGIDKGKANEIIRDMFFRLAEEHIMPIPDVRHFKVSEVHPPPMLFNGHFTVTLEKKSGNFLYTGMVASQEENVPYFKVEYSFIS